MRRLVTGMCVVLAVVFLTYPSLAADRGTARGQVVRTGAWTSDDGRMRLTVTIQNEGLWEATFSVGAENRDAFATLGTLRKGEQVTVGWVREDDRNWIRDIVRGGGADAPAVGEEGGDRVRVEKREGDRERAEKKEVGERELHERGEEERRERVEGDRERVEKREGGERERVEKKEGGDRERAEKLARAERERVEKKEGGDRERAEKKEGGDRERAEKREGGDRERAEKRDGDRERVEKREEGERVVARREGEGVERREGQFVRELRRNVEVLSVTEAEDGVVLKVKILEGNDVITFRVKTEARELVRMVETLRQGNKARAAWRQRGTEIMLREIVKID